MTKKYLLNLEQWYPLINYKHYLYVVLGWSVEELKELKIKKLKKRWDREDFINELKSDLVDGNFIRYLTRDEYIYRWWNYFKYTNRNL